MKKSAKIAISCGVAFALCCIVIAGYVTQHVSQDQRPTEDQSAEQSVYVVSSTHDLAINVSDPTAMKQASTYVALVKIDSIDGANNYSEVSGEYVLPYTYGHMTVLENIIGDLPVGESLEFYRLGGTVPVDQYYNGLTEVEKERFDAAKENNVDLASAAQIKEMSDDDIDVEAGKTYLVYLVDETAYYAKPDTYAIIGFAGGLREVRTDSGEAATFSADGEAAVQVLNNFTGEWERLDDVFPARSVQ